MKDTNIEYTVKKLKKSEVEITCTVPEDIYQQAKKRACEQISKDVKVKGFRPGHVPPHILELHVDQKYITAHTQDLAIQRCYAEAVVKEKLQIVARPKVKITSEEPLTFVATVPVMPDVEVKDYKSIKVKKEDDKVSEKDVQAVLDDLKKYSTVYKDVDRAAKKGDRVEIDFEGFDDGKPVEGTASKNHPVVLGENTLIPGFEDEVVGMKKDDEKEFDIKFPKDYGKEDFQGRKMKFKVKLHRIEQPEETKMDEAFVEKVSGKKQSLEDFKKEIETNLKAKKAQEVKQKQENDYIEALLKKTKVEIPEGLLDEEAEYILQEMKEEISMKGMEFAKFLEQAKTNEDDLRKKYRPEAERRIKMRLALQHVIKEEGIKVTDKDITDELANIKSAYPESEHAKIDKDFETGTLKSGIANRLTLRKLFAKVLA